MRRRVTVPLFVVLIVSRLSVSDHAAEPRAIYGIHDFDPRPDGFITVLEARGARGTITATEAIGHDPADRSGKDYRGLSARGHRIITRLNNGYGSAGTIPLRSRWGNFATRCANFAAASRGCTIWVIGNETNLWGEWPAEPNGHRQRIMPEDYAECFRGVYDAIKAARPDDLVIPQALAPFAGPYGGGTEHDGMPIDHVTYMRRMLDAIRSSGGVDGIAIHVSCRGYSPSDVFSTAQVNGNYWSFFCYKDWLERGIPGALWHLPVYATESNGYYFWKGGHPEVPSRQYEAGWVQTALLEIDRWNHNEAVVDGKPMIRSLNFYRWCSFCDGWNIDGAPQEAQILADLGEAVSYDLTWPDPGEVHVAPFVIEIGRRTPPLEKDHELYRGVWRSYVFRVDGTAPVPVTFELTGAANAEGDDDDARLLVDGDSPTDDATWNTAASLDGSRDQGRTATARFVRNLSPGRHVLRLQIDRTPFIEKIEAKVPAPPAGRLIRGDTMGDQVLNLTDVIFILVHLFGGRETLDCLDAADIDDSGAINLVDVLSLLSYIFTRQPPPAPPTSCGEDPTPDPLGDCAPDRC